MAKTNIYQLQKGLNFKSDSSLSMRKTEDHLFVIQHQSFLKCYYDEIFIFFFQPFFAKV